MTREPGSRWVPHPAFRHRLYPKCVPPPPSLAPPRSAEDTIRDLRPRSPLAALGDRRPDRPSLPPHPGAGNAAGAQAAPLVAASLPHLNRPRPTPQGPARGRAAATGFHNPTGDWGRGATSRQRPRSEEGARRPPVGIPSHPAPSRRVSQHPSPSAPQWAGVGDRNRLPTWRTGSGPARRREHSSHAGSGGSGPGELASGAGMRSPVPKRGV